MLSRHLLNKRHLFSVIQYNILPIVKAQYLLTYWLGKKWEEMSPLSWMSSIIGRYLGRRVIKDDVNLCGVQVNKLRCQQSKQLSRKHWHHTKTKARFANNGINGNDLRNNQEKVYIGSYLFPPNSVWDRPLEAL